MWSHFVEQLLIVLTAGFAASFVCRRLGLPTLFGYLTVGALLGEGALNWVRTEGEQIARVAELGVFFLLFSIGLELSVDDLKRMGRTMLLGGSVQMGLVAATTAVMLFLAGQAAPIALLIGLALSFSSTVLVFKAVGELGLTGSRIGRSAIAILLFQDAALVPLLLWIPLLAGVQQQVGWHAWAKLALTSVAFLIGTLALRQLLLHVIVPRMAKDRNLDQVLLLTLVVLGLVTFSAEYFGLPPAVGAFAAGVAFGGSRWSGRIDALIFPFREVFSAVFFVSLGLLMNFTALWQQPFVSVGLWLLLILYKILAAALALRLTGVRWSVAWPAGVGMAHVGEFAFVIILGSTSAGILSQDESRFLITLAGGTLLVSPTLIRWGFTRAAATMDETTTAAASFAQLDLQRSAIVIGMGPVGAAVATRLESTGFDVSAIDQRPLNLQEFALMGFHTLTGDGESDEVLHLAGVQHLQLAVVCVPADDIALRITRKLRKKNPTMIILVRCRYAISREGIRRAGANEVIAEESQAALELIRWLDEHAA